MHLEVNYKGHVIMVYPGRPNCTVYFGGKSFHYRSMQAAKLAITHYLQRNKNHVGT